MDTAIVATGGVSGAALLYHRRYAARAPGFSPLKDSWRRYRLALDLFDQLGLLARRLVLDQSMIMAALANALNDRAMQRHFARDPVSWAAHLYLSYETMSIQ